MTNKYLLNRSIDKETVNFVNNADKIKVEIYWMFDVGSNSSSVNSNDGMNKMFKKCFPIPKLVLNIKWGELN